MSGAEILEKYPKAGVVVRQFYTNQLLDSLQGDSYPEEFKEFVKAQPLENEQIADFINTAPRGLFDVFDANDIYIQIGVYPDKTFNCTINELGTTSFFATRKEAEAYAVEAAFEILNNKL